MSFKGHFEDQKFAEKPGGERNASKRHHGNQKAKSQKRSALAETIEVNNVVAVGVSSYDHQDQEREQSHQQVSSEVDGYGQTRVPRTDCRYRNEKITGVADA